MSNDRRHRSIVDLDKAIQVICRHFREDTVVIIGSQAALVGWPHAPEGMRLTPEIDLYFAGIREWERLHPGTEASEEIDGLFGRGSPFDGTYGFFIDGVSPTTAPLPIDWQRRAVFRECRVDDRIVTAVAPSIEDLVVSKMGRLAEKDRSYIEACHAARPLDLDLVCERIAIAPLHEALRERAVRYVRTLPVRPPYRIPREEVVVPCHPPDTHAAFWSPIAPVVSIRELDAATGLYVRLGNPLGPAMAAPMFTEAYALHGRKMSYESWATHPEVVAARSMAADDDRGAHPRP